jgi:hypothetical protein
LTTATFLAGTARLNERSFDLEDTNVENGVCGLVQTAQMIPIESLSRDESLLSVFGTFVVQY